MDQRAMGKMSAMETKATKEIGDDELAMRMMGALRERDLTHDQIIAIGGSPHRAVAVLESLQAAGMVECYGGPIQPSTCMYRLAARG